MSGQFVPVKLNAEKDGQPAAKKYDVHGFPTILFIDGEGNIEGKIGGYMPPEGFAPEMEWRMRVRRELPSWEAKINRNPNDAAVAANLAAVFAGKDQIDKAESMLAVAERGGAPGGSLARTYNAIGDYYQGAGKFDRAIPLFEKGAKVGKTPNDIAYALSSLAITYGQAGKPKQGIPALRKLIALPGAPKVYVDMAKEQLAAVEKTPDKQE